MADRCPACGGEMEFTGRTVVLRAGTCPSCQKEIAFVEGSMLSEHLGAAPEVPEATPVGAPAVVAEGGPECDECGAPLVVRAGRGGALLAVCEDCETTTLYRPEVARSEPEGERRQPARGRYPETGGPRSRPCRRCGAPLRFSTGEDGMLVGECDSCGNRFILPPRTGGGRDSTARNRPSYGRRGYGQSRGSRPGFRDRGPAGPRAYRSEGPRGRPRTDDDERRRRRRPRDE